MEKEPLKPKRPGIKKATSTPKTGSSIDETNLPLNRNKIKTLSEAQDDLLEVEDTPSLRKTIARKKSYIIKNVQRSHAYIADLGIHVEPLDILDLTHYPEDYINSSRDLRRALKAGIFERITEDEYDKIETKKIREEQDNLFRREHESAKQRQTYDYDGKQIDAEIINLNKADSGRSEESRISGSNDPLAYAAAYRLAQKEYRDNGKELDSDTFAKMVERDPNLVEKYVLAAPQGRGISSGERGSGRATVLFPAGNDGETHAGNMSMGNFIRDGYMSGFGEDYSGNPLSEGWGEEIDLADEE